MKEIKDFMVQATIVDIIQIIIMDMGIIIVITN